MPELFSEDHLEELRTLADSVRNVIDATVKTGVDYDAMGRAAELLRAVAAELSAVERQPLAPPDLDALRRAPHHFFAWDPQIGPANPLAANVRMEVDGDTVHGHVTFPRAYQGPPGQVHGGVIAGVYDQVLGLANFIVGRPGFTGTLSVRYVAPTPLGAPLRFEARQERSERRKLFTSGRCFHGDTLVSTAEGIFISRADMPFQPSPSTE
ncbi:MAG: PaaI family thioesterase [Actinobacteria bacterium]|nr:PaaI family thioesterase [Actinomycetota bacterium]MBV9253455.1 PaaI family thioesterase [Actinomycetota bacterium]